jgi:hypothetical protein
VNRDLEAARLYRAGEPRDDVKSDDGVPMGKAIL